MAEVIEVVEEKAEVSVQNEKTEVAHVEDKAKLLSANPFESKQSLNDYFTMAKVLAGSTMVPQSYQGNPSNCLIALEQAARMNCSPLMVMQQLYVVKGKPSWSGQACSMIVNGCGLFKSVKLNYVGEPGKENRGGRPRRKPVDNYQEIYDEYLTGKIGRKECESKLNLSEKSKLCDDKNFKSYLKEIKIYNI